MTQINPNINQYNNYQANASQMSEKQRLAKPIQASIGQLQQPVKIPNFYYVPDNYEHKSFKETVKEVDMMGVITPFIEYPLLVLPTWFALNFGADAYSKACGGKYETSLVGKAARLGDRIQESKLIQSKPAQSVIKGLGSVKNAGAKAVQNSALLRAMRDTPTMPEWSLVKSQMFNQKQEVVQEFVRIADNLKLGEAGSPKLANVGLTKAEKEMLKKTFNVTRISEIPETKVINQVLLSRLGRSQAQIDKIQALGEKSIEATKKEILKEMGITPEKLKLIKNDILGKYVPDVEEAVSKVRNKVKIGAGHFKWLGPLTKPFERTIGCDEIYNKLHSMSGGAKTATGRFTSKLMQMVYRGLTFGGGKAGLLLFIAPLLIEVAMNTRKADKDQKVGTFMGSLIQSMSWVVTFPLALRMLHSFGGVKYAGMTKEQVETFRETLKQFNEKAKSSQFKTKADYKKAKKALKDMLKVKDQNIFTKGIRKLGQFLTMDLETFKPYKSSNIAANMGRKLPNVFRNIGGVPMRLLLWAGISTGVLDTLIHKGSTAIFGKSYDSMKKEEQDAEKKAQKQFLRKDLNERLYEAQKIKQYGAVQQQIQPVQNQQANMISTRGKNEGKDGDKTECKNISSEVPPVINPQPLNQKQKEEKVDNYTYIPSSENIIPHPLKKDSIDTYTYIPSSENIISKSDKENKSEKKYIPSQTAANIQKSFDNSGLQAALERAQRAEENALKILAGNFDGMV